MSNLVRAQPIAKATARRKEARGRGDTGRIVRLLGRFLAGQQRRQFTLALLMLLAEAITAVFEAYPLAYLIDYLKGDRPDLMRALGLPQVVSPVIDTVALLTLAIIVMAMINSFADSMAEIYLARGGRMLGFNLRVALYSHVQRLSLAFHHRRRTGDMLTRVTADVASLEDFVTASVGDLAGSILVLVGTLAFLLYNSWQVALVATLIVPLLALVSNYFSQRIKAAAKKQRAREGDLASAAQEMLTSIRVIQTYSRGGYEQARFAEQSQKSMEAALEAAGLQARFSWVVKVMEALAISAIVWLGLWLIDSATITVGTLLLFIILIQNMFKPTRKIIREWNTVGKIYASVERIGEVFDRKPAVQDEPGAVDAPPFAGSVEFRRVSFAYELEPEDAAQLGVDAPGAGPRPALHDINLSIAAGEVVALVGHSGAGKSTLAQLLPRLYDPQEGQVLIDGHDIRTFTLDSLRSQISMVLQETILFSGSVADNIAYGYVDATREQIVAAAKQANAHEFIEKMPEGYDTQLSERASNLSGGQRQRIAIARAFIRNTPILILDEPTTGLDAESRDLVLLALRTLMKGKTTIIISHDLNLIRHADKIVVIDHGRIEQVGTHKGLLSEGGLYANLYAKQFSDTEHDSDFGFSISDFGLEASTPNSGGAMPSGHERATSAAGVAVDGLEPPGEALAALVPERHGEAQPVRSTVEIDGYVWQLEPEASGVRCQEVSGNTTGQVEVQGPRAGHEPGPELAKGGSKVQSQEDSDLGPWTLEPGPWNLAGRLPGLPAALGGEVMRKRLQAALFGEAQPNYTIESCAPGQAVYLPALRGEGEACTLRYKLQVKDAGSAALNGHGFQALVLGRVFPDLRSCCNYTLERLAPLERQMQGREEVAPFAAPVAIIEPLNMVVHVFPIDGELPTLAGATDRRRMLELFRETLPEAVGHPFDIEDCRVELGHYGRQHRCVLRYEITGRLPGSGESRHYTIYGKVAADGRGALAGPVIEALREQALGDGKPYHFNIPRSFGFHPELQLSLLEGIPGVPRVAQSLKARIKGKPEMPGALTLEEMIDACARIASALHTSGITLGPRRTLADEVLVLRQGFAAVQEISPELGEQLQRRLRQVETYAETTQPLELCFSHGDFTYTQLIFDGMTAGLVDFDTVCQAEPALDLGQFLAYLRLADRKAIAASLAPTSPGLAQQLGTQFLSAYIEASGYGPQDEEQLRARVLVYELVSLMRIALHSWQKLKASRLEHATTVLEERMLCLPR